MADETAASAEDSPITFTIKSSNDAKYTLTLPLSTTVSDLKEKLASSEYADTPAERQRLIYSGRVLKDNETLATYKIKEGHTIHLVKSAASNQRSGAATQSASTSAPTGAAANTPATGVPTNLAAGTGNNPLAGLTGARYAGFAQLPGAGMFGPDGGMGPPPDTEMMLSMLENPQFQSTLNEALQNPAMIDMMIQQNPMLRDMGPAARQIFQSPEFRRMLTDPNSIRQMASMQRAMGGGGLGGSAFPAPGVTNTTPEENRNTQNNNGSTPTPNAAFNPFMPTGLGAGNPFAALFGGNPAFGGIPPSAAGNTQSGSTGSTDGAPEATTGNNTNNNTTTPGANQQQTPQNPFSLLLNPALFGGQGGQGGLNPLDPQQNPFLRDPAMLQQIMQNIGGAPGNAGATGSNPFAALFGEGFGAPAPQDNRSIEERYADQLRQLNDMGFYDFDRNIAALRRSGGSVQGAVEYLLSG
ncbi:ubiquitin domain-containing protein DSK2 [Aspergillus saccharolyticus JOP 1030-1]|uniref:Ubiquitin-like protein DskB n=1 Tax=Aspergillus saccharolyticus JOP 1030-1 TaxID=1450539 RepID=A0A318ZRE5_9EURO|nr:ubiquitin-like protein DskB [Aspergillus saccharolyticus JOP 1030-1]PYH46933.1 ubiquitin-like protein DskB [Aspergillus saccharolyticus JOP 1030-1]